jgi:L-cysteine S-thiosulfotransferase
VARQRHFVRAGVVALAVAVCAAANAQAPEQPAGRPLLPKSGTVFQSTATQAVQADDAINPGMLWVEKGLKHWAEPAGALGKSCASCHDDAAQTLRGAATRYPQIDAATGALINLEGRINQCRTVRQGATAFAYESQELLGLTAYLSMQSRGLKPHVSVTGPAAPYFDTGRSLFMTRQGQLNVSCAQCHDDNVGRKLRGDPISQGHPTGWPGYRLEWQTVGSLHRRLRACSLGVRAEILDFGSPEYLALELYLAWRAQDLAVEAPAVRR